MEDLADVLEIEQNEINDDFVLGKGNWDSLAVVATISLIDEHFGITIKGDDLRNCPTVGALWQLIQDNLGA